MSEEIGKVKVAAETLKTIMDIAADSPDLKEAGENISTTALTLTKAVNNVLLPIAAVNFAFDKGKKYFEEKFASDLEKTMERVPKEAVIEPKASLAAPVLQGLAFSFDEPDLKEMYLKLLSSAMDARSQSKAHPAFSEIIKQLTQEEAEMLAPFIAKPISIPVVKLKKTLESKGFIIVMNHLVNLTDTATKEVGQNLKFPTMVDNWIRLGIVSVDYDIEMRGENRYSWVESRPEYAAAKAELIDDEKLSFEKGVFHLTDFGKSFGQAVT